MSAVTAPPSSGDAPTVIPDSPPKVAAPQLTTAEKVAKVFIIAVIMGIAGVVGFALTTVFTITLAKFGYVDPYLAAGLASAVSFTPAILAVGEVTEYFKNRAAARLQVS